VGQIFVPLALHESGNDEVAVYGFARRCIARMAAAGDVGAEVEQFLAQVAVVDGERGDDSGFAPLAGAVEQSPPVRCAEDAGLDGVGVESGDGGGERDRIQVLGQGQFPCQASEGEGGVKTPRMAWDICGRARSWFCRAWAWSSSSGGGGGARRGGWSDCAGGRILRCHAARAIAEGSGEEGEADGFAVRVGADGAGGLVARGGVR